MDGSLAFADLRDKGISRQTFSLPAHQQIWTPLETVAGTGGTVDALTVIARLEAQGQLCLLYTSMTTEPSGMEGSIE